MKLIFYIALSAFFISCSKSKGDVLLPVEPGNPAQVKKDSFLFGADLSNVNNILDHGGVYKVQGQVQDPYKIFKDNGAQLARFRLWHNPTWTKTSYGAGGTQLYNDLYDVEKAMNKARQQGLKLLLDLHYSDTWADPATQRLPAAWSAITNINVLRDSVNNYTRNVLQYLESKSLMPDYIQIGNEINCGMLYTGASSSFPQLNVCNGNWQNMGIILNAGISAVRSVANASSIKPKIILHVADPKNADWWFENIRNNAGVSDFEIIGISYYPTWHRTVAISQIAEQVTALRNKFAKKVMMMETAYPWTTGYNDSYNNLMGTEANVAGYPYSEQGQQEFLKYFTQQLINGGASGIVYWEPAWITSSMKDLYGTGSSWENVAFFDFNGNVHKGINYMNHGYQWKP